MRTRLSVFLAAMLMLSLTAGRVSAGQKLIIEKIKAVGPDGRTRDLNPIILKIN